MRLSEWRAAAPHRDAMSAKVLAVVSPVLGALARDADPDCWVSWGDEPATRYAILVPTPPGLVVCHVRVNIPQQGPRAAARLVRWNRAQLGELAIETQAQHRILSFQVEGQVIRGVDGDVDHAAAFALSLFDAVDGRALPVSPPAPKRRPAATPAGRGRGRSGGSKAPRQLPARTG